VTFPKEGDTKRNILVAAIITAILAGCGGGSARPMTTPLLGTATPISQSALPDASAASVEHATPGFVQFEFRVVLSGPASASPGEDITYLLEYQRVSGLNRSGSRGIVIVYNLVMGSAPPQPAATLVSVKALVGPQPTNLIPQGPGLSENCDFGGDAGTLQIVVRPTTGFSGPLTVLHYVRGTSIEFPRGSVNEVTTEVS
jgi:hypothetical protein